MGPARPQDNETAKAKVTRLRANVFLSAFLEARARRHPACRY
jgi:hypothetical protein